MAPEKLQNYFNPNQNIVLTKDQQDQHQFYVISALQHAIQSSELQLHLIEWNVICVQNSAAILYTLLA